MNLHKLAAKKDSGRGSLELVNVEEDKIVATNGFIMAIVPNTEGIEPGMYTAESFGKHEKDGKYPLEKEENILIYPDYQHVLDDAENSTKVFKISLNIDLLKTLADALREDKSDPWIMTLEFSDKSEAVMVYPHSAGNPRKGLIMPCYLSGG
jgi:hypothetical protein